METTITKPNEYVKTAIAKFDFNEEKLTAFRKECEGLTINGILDRDGYEKVRAQLGKLRTTRTTIEAKRKEIKAPLLEAGRMVDDYAKNLTEQLQGIETPLKVEKDQIDTEKERIRLQKEREEQERINGRISLLIQNGMSFNGHVYAIGELSIDSLQIKQYGDGEFDGFLTGVKAEHQKELDRKAEEERMKEAEEERQRREREEFEAKQRAFAEQQERVQKEQEEAARKLREEQGKVEAERRELQEQKEREERERLARIERERAECEAAERAAREAEESKRLEGERAARLEAMKPDREKIVAYVDALLAVEAPEVKNDEALDLVMRIKRQLETLAESAKRGVGAI